MSFVTTLKNALAPYHLLKHPFYQKWTEGRISKENLQYYASQYYHHVKAFPRYISALHSLCENEKDRKIILENLNDEEGTGEGCESHPDLWMHFAEGLGLKKEDVQKSEMSSAIKNVIKTFFSYCRSSYAKGLSALYSYEYQVPEVAETKMTGLKNHYGISDKKILSFFQVHQLADVYHREAIEALLEKLSPEDQKEAKESAVTIAKALWDFLTHVEQQESVSTVH